LSKKSRKRLGREESTRRILDAARMLFAERGYTAVSVREIAAAAGVSHALVHRYLGGKKEVYRAVLSRDEDTIRDTAAGEEDLLQATRLMLREAWEKERTYVRLLAHSALHCLPFDRTIGHFPATERLIELAAATVPAGETSDPSGPGPRFVVISLVAMLFGWAAARDWLLAAAGLQDMSEEEHFAAFERVVLDIERLYFPSPEAPGGS